MGRGFGLTPDGRRQTRPSYRGRAALITGASSGLGAAFAHALAGRGASVLLTALPADRTILEALGAEVRAHYGVRAEVVTADLACRDAAHRLQAAADALDFDPDLLVNNAGVGLLGPFIETPLESQLRMIHVNVEALVALTGLYVPRMVARRHGAVLNVASTAAFQPFPHFAVYAAAKAFVVSFGQALWAECHPHGVRVISVCPGPMANTRFGESVVPGGVGAPRYKLELQTQGVIESALRALEDDQPLAVRRVPPFGLLYGLVTSAAGLVPRRLRLQGAERLSRWYFQVR